MTISRRRAIGFLGSTVLAAGMALPVFAAGDTIKIGMTAPLTGAAAEVGKLQSDGAKLAVEQINAAGGVDGKKLELVIEDDQTTNPGIVLAFSKLVNRGDLTAIIGSLRSTQVKALSPDAKKAGIPVFFGGTDPSLTHTGNPWLFRARPNDSFSAKVIADYGLKTLKKKKWAIVYSTDAFGTNGAKSLQAELKAAGIEPVLMQGFNSSQADLTPVVLAVRKSGADIVSTYVALENDVAVLARQFKQFGVNVPWVGSPSVGSTTARQLAGPALYNTYAVADFNADANPEAKTFAAQFSKEFGRDADYTSAWPYDSVNIAAAAIKKAGSTDPQKLRDALVSMKGYKGAEGAYDFDENGDGLRGYNIVQNKGGKITFVKHIDFDKGASN